MTSSTATTQTVFAEQFREFIKGETNDAVRKLREQAFASFTASGFPTPKNEDWKYTNVASLVSGQWSVAGDQSDEIAAGDMEIAKRFAIDRNGFAALNLAFGEITVIRIAKDTSIAEPFELNFAAAENTAIFPHVLIIAEAGSKATIIESYASQTKSFTNAAVQVIVEDNASVTHYRVQKDGAEAFNIGTTEVSLGRDSRYDSTNINLGAAISRHDIDLKFTAEGGEAWVDGLYMLGGRQHSDTHSVIDHTVPNCVSHQTYKGVLNDHSRGVFNGKVFVRENAFDELRQARSGGSSVTVEPPYCTYGLSATTCLI